ncbi:MAG: replication initiator protein A [Lachnospiraceae bacterium]|nr:replication initiator protein A [Lachnospiraceae bacterium]
MSDTIRFDYYYGQEAEQFTFFRIPKLLITDAKFSKLSNDAKLLYGLLLDRMSLSLKNGWIDEKNRVYIVYTIQSIEDDMNCGTGKAVKLLAELDSKKGIGLIERKRMGQGKPDILYVKNFAATPHETTDFRKSKFKDSDNRNSKVTEIESPELRKTEPNNTYSKKTENNKTDPIRIFEERMAMVRENICYDWHLKNDNSADRELYLQLYNIIETVMADGSEQIRIGDSLLYAEVVKSRMLKLNEMHLKYVIDCVSEQTGEIKRMNRYLLAALYHALETYDMYYTQRVHHDFYGGYENVDDGSKTGTFG